VNCLSEKRTASIIMVKFDVTSLDLRLTYHQFGSFRFKTDILLGLMLTYLNKG